MIRLAIVVEGETEEAFVNNVLASHLRAREVEPYPILLGGNVTVDRLAAEMSKLYWSFDHVTSLVDFYGFKGKGDLPRDDLEQRISATIDRGMSRSWEQSRAFPYVQQYEFEGLLFSDVVAFETVLNVPEGPVGALQSIRSRFPTPEDINDSPNTAPSKRIEDIIPGYRKVAFGSLVAGEIGLDVIRSECPRFNAWVTRLESLA